MVPPHVLMYEGRRSVDESDQESQIGPGAVSNTTRVRSKTPEPPPKIRLGDLVRVITRVCRFRGILHERLDAFTAVLDKYTLADLTLGPKDSRVRPAA